MPIVRQNKFTKAQYAARRLAVANELNTKLNTSGTATITMPVHLAISFQKQMKKLHPSVTVVLNRDPETFEAILVATDQEHPVVKAVRNAPKPVSIFEKPLKDRPGF